MSTTKSNAAVFVIIRAFADEPVRLQFVGVRGNAVDAIGSDKNSPMPFHLARTYRFDEGLYGKLRKAFESSNHAALAKLWEAAKPFDPRK